MFTYLEHGGANTLSLGWINSQLQFHVMVNGPKTQLPYRSIMIRVRKQIYWRNNVAPIGIDELFLTHSGSAMVSNFSKEKVVTTDTERTSNTTFKGLQLWQEYVHPEWVFSCNDIGVHLQCHIKARLASFLLVTVKWARDWAIALSKEKKLNSNFYGSKQVIAVFLCLNSLFHSLNNSKWVFSCNGTRVIFRSHKVILLPPHIRRKQLWDKQGWRLGYFPKEDSPSVLIHIFNIHPHYPNGNRWRSCVLSVLYRTIFI